MMKFFSGILLFVFLVLPVLAFPVKAQEDPMASIQEIAESFPPNVGEFKLKDKKIIPCKEDERLKPECSANGGFLLEYRSDSGLKDASLYLFDVSIDLISDKQGAKKKEETGSHAFQGETIHDIEVKSINGANHPLIERLWIIEKERFSKEFNKPILLFSTGLRLSHEGIALNGSFRTAFYRTWSTGFIGGEGASYALALGAFHGIMAKVEFRNLPNLLNQTSGPHEIISEFLDKAAVLLSRQSKVVVEQKHSAQKPKTHFYRPPPIDYPPPPRIDRIPCMLLGMQKGCVRKR
jgi:hypothetical protein